MSEGHHHHRHSTPPALEQQPRSSELYDQTPLVTRSILALLILIYLWQLIFEPEIKSLVMSPEHVLYDLQIHRLVTSTLLHGSAMHIGMNGTSWMGIGRVLEKKYGSLYVLTIVLFGMVADNSVYTIIAYTAKSVLGWDVWMKQRALGFSGVLFQLSVLDAFQASEPTRSVFGIRVPTKLYPWALLFALQILIPGVSFIGHLSGAVVGTLILYGTFDCVLPSQLYLKKLEEECSRFQFITELDGFVRVPEISESDSVPRHTRRLATLPFVFVANICKVVKHILETIQYCLGYGPHNDIVTAEDGENVILVGSDGVWRENNDGSATEIA